MMMRKDGQEMAQAQETKVRKMTPAQQIPAMMKKSIVLMLSIEISHQLHKIQVAQLSTIDCKRHAVGKWSSSPSGYDGSIMGTSPTAAAARTAQRRQQQRQRQNQRCRNESPILQSSKATPEKLYYHHPNRINP